MIRWHYSLHCYYTSPSHWCTIHEPIEIANFTTAAALSAGTLMASAGTPYRLVPTHFYPWFQSTRNNAPVGRWSIVMSVYVCIGLSLSVYLCICTRVCESTRPHFTKVYAMYATCGHGSVFPLMRCDMLCTSAEVDGVTFAPNGQKQVKRTHSGCVHIGYVARRDVATRRIRFRRTFTHRVVSSQSPWSRYDRHFVGITRYNALS